MIIATLTIEATLLLGLFVWQSNWSPDQWNSRGWWTVMVGAVYSVIGAATGAIAAEVAFLADAINIGPENLAGDVVSAVFGAIGGVVNLFGFGASAGHTFLAEQSDLGQVL